MKIKLQLSIENDDGEIVIKEELMAIERDTLCLDNLGLSLDEAKQLLAGVQQAMVNHQVEEYVEQHRYCPHCHGVRSCKGHHQIRMRTLFGKLSLTSPRFYQCDCESSCQKSFSPLAQCLAERHSPELLYLETKWASLMSYGLSVDLLQEVLPIVVSATTVKRQVQRLAQRSEDELDEESYALIEGTPMEWNQLPYPDMPLMVGLDGGYIHARDGDNRKAGWFEVIVGKSLSQERTDKRFGFVNKYDQKRRRRIFETLKMQGFQMNQGITFISDGGDTVCDLQFYISPQSEHLLDWFHITMRITVMRQLAKGLPDNLPADISCDVDHELERVKWFLWHGNTFKALQSLHMLITDLEVLEDFLQSPIASKLLKLVCEFEGYISDNQSFIPNYGDRYRYGEVISTAFVESTVNQLISKRFVKKQQMRWTDEGAHLLLQIRIQVLNGDWRDTFVRWYPNMPLPDPNIALVA
jgi:hypothetical protein